MRLSPLALLASAILLGACAGGGDQQSSDAVDTPAAQPTTTAQAGSGQPAPITGTTHEVRMMFDGQKYFFEPANLTIKQGDGVKWILVAGQPHNVQFKAGQFPAAAEAQLTANMQSSTGLMGPMLLQPNEEYTVSFAGLPAGTYNYVCTPHEMFGMTGSIVVE